MSEGLNSPFIVPVVAMMIPIVAIIAGVWGSAQKARVKADQRMAMLARGIPLAEVEAVLAASDKADDQPSHDPLRRVNNARRAAIILISAGLGLILFFLVLEVILQVRPVLAGAAAGLIPLAIGIGFWIDYRLQLKELGRFGLELGEEGR